jgi:hypothetical protein
MSESLEEFKDSFSYGNRNDLSFKFLKKLAPDRAAEAIRQILEAVGTSFDTGEVGELHDLVIRWQVAAYAPEAGSHRKYVYPDAPWALPTRPLEASRVGLMASSGHFVAGDDPEPFGVKDMTQLEAVDRIGEFLRETPVLSTIPRDFDPADLRVRHGGYDIRSAVKDFNVTFPRDALLAAQAGGHIGAVADPLFSFPGAASQGRLRKHALPGWVEMLHEAAIDVLLLVPV